jgi:hypothetical protein
MNFIEKIVVTCNEQEDYTGSDDLTFYINGALLGYASIVTGQTKSFDAGSAISAFRDGIIIAEGDRLQVWEHDLIDSSELLLDYTVTDADISNGSVSLIDICDSADYVFDITFI